MGFFHLKFYLYILWNFHTYIQCILIIPTCIVYGYYCCYEITTKSNLGGKGILHSQFHITVPHLKQLGQELTQGSNLEVGTDPEAISDLSPGVHDQHGQ